MSSSADALCGAFSSADEDTFWLFAAHQALRAAFINLALLAGFTVYASQNFDPN